MKFESALTKEVLFYRLEVNAIKRIWPYIPSLPRVSWIDGVVALFVFGLLYAIVKLSSGMGVPFSYQNQPHILLEWWMLPYYAGRSLLRMFIAFFCSIIFTFVYGRLAASSAVAEKIMVPLLDILQSVPVLGFLSITVTGFMGLFPHSLFGVELASIFAIFTGQAWNMAFSFYHSVSALPRELREAAAINGLDPFTRFTRLELPYSMIGLVWNSMMSFGGGWFFLTVSESITVLNHTIYLPGIGSFIATAMTEGNIPALIEAIIAMILVIVLVDQFFWRPIVAWAQKFKMELSGNEDIQTSWFLRLLRRSKLAQWISEKVFGRMFRAVDRRMLQLAKRRRLRDVSADASSSTRRLFRYSVATIALVAVLYFVFLGVHAIATLGIHKILYVFMLGFYTMLRVTASTILAVLWTVPVGVAIGLNPKASRIAQPIVQVAASFPGNLFFPLITLLYLVLHVNFQFGAIPLMMLGTQWYILFNVIAGAMSIPNDLREATKVLGLRGRERWKRLYLPGIFPYLVTGCITASGGAWNASIVAEIVSWKGRTLVASGLGAYITQTEALHQWPVIILSITVMAVFVTVINRAIWRPLYRMAETRYNVG